MSTTITRTLATLELKNRAYQVLYALSDTPETVRTLTANEALHLVSLVEDVLGGQRVTDLDNLLASRMSRRMLEYVAHGMHAAIR